MRKSKNGITLISLIITIIVLLILAAVTINMVLGENGLINKAKTSVGKYKNSQEKENNIINKYTNTINSYEYSNREETSLFNYSEKVKRILEIANKKYTVEIIDLLKDDDIFNIVINNESLLRDEEIFNAIIEYSKTINLKTVPILSNNTNCVGTTQFDDRFALYKAFDNTNSAYAPISGGEFYLGYKFTNPVYVVKYSIIQRGYTSLEEGVDNIYLCYSDDGINFVQAGEIKTAVHSDSSEQTFYADYKTIGKHNYWAIKGNTYGGCGGLKKLQFYGIE